jgi:hypothetical protein
LVAADTLSLHFFTAGAKKESDREHTDEAWQGFGAAALNRTATAGQHR